MDSNSNLSREKFADLEVSSASNSIEIVTLKETIDELTQEKHDLRSELARVLQENQELVKENKLFKAELEEDPLQDRVHEAKLQRIEADRKEAAERQQDEYFKLEALLQVSNSRNEYLDEQLRKAQTKIASMEKSANEFQAVIDELDALRESEIRARQYEADIRSYRRRLDKLENLRDSMAELQAHNQELLKAIEKSENVTKQGSTELDVLRKDWTEIQLKLSAETQKSTTAQTDCRLLAEKLRIAESRIAQFEAARGAVGSQSQSAELEHDDDDVSIQTALHLQQVAAGGRENQSVDQDEESGESRQAQAPPSPKIWHPLADPDQENEFVEIDLNSHNDNKTRVVALVEQQQSAVKGGSEDLDAVELLGLERENKLLASAFFNLSLNLYQSSVEQRNTTFLQTHRRQAVKK